MRSFNQNLSGFSLVELSIVVAIVGVLAVIGVPTYRGMVAKARQAEAKVSLGAAYTLEVAFRQEFQSYTGCVAQLGEWNNGNGKNYYSVGMINASSLNCGPNANNECDTFRWDSSGMPLERCEWGAGMHTYATAAEGTVAPACSLYVNNHCPLLEVCARDGSACEAKRDTFRIGAAGFIKKGAVYDFWSIDQDRVLTHLQEP